MKAIIKKQIDWYYKNSHKAGIETLLKFQDKLSANYYYYAEIYNNELLDYAKKYGEYKNKFARTYLENIAKKIQEKITSKEAEEISKEETIGEWTNQMFASANIESTKIEIKAIDKILNSVSQRISYLKNEKKNI